ncbi:MAG: IS66 family transposase [Gammaproteobacteria bacterium]|nr:IS66 family transposase [Gammaproteobacteria bacterium]
MQALLFKYSREHAWIIHPTFNSQNGNVTGLITFRLVKPQEKALPRMPEIMGLKAGHLIQPVINLLRDRLLAYDIIQMDETPVQVLKESGKSAQSKSYLWLQRGGPPDQPVLLYEYDPGRSANVPRRLLAGFAGYLQTDGYAGYHAAVAIGALTHLGCMAHARRKFSDAIKAQGKKKKKGHAHQGLLLIQKRYQIEKQARVLTPVARSLRLALA